MVETVKRSAVKAMSWRVISTLVMMGIVLVFTGNLVFAISAGIADVVIKLILYFVHERIWHKIRWGIKQQKGQVVWFTGPAYSGKTTVAKKIETELKKKNYNVVRLDGEVVYRMFPSATEYNKAIRDKHVKRMGHIAALLAQHGVVVLCTMVSPFQDQRDYVRKLVENFMMVYVTCDESEFERRTIDNGLDKEVLEEIQQSLKDYEEPTDADVTVRTDRVRSREAIKEILNQIK